MLKSIPKLIISIAVPQAVAVIGSLFTRSSVSGWYSKLNKPSFNPPGWIFGPVWTILYLLMGISLYLVWTSGKKGIKAAIIIFAVQLSLNLLWSILFFGMQKPFAAFIEIILLWIAILVTIIVFYKISPIAAYLLIPYILWVSFAAVLNYNLYALN